MMFTALFQDTKQFFRCLSARSQKGGHALSQDADKYFPDCVGLKTQLKVIGVND